MPSSGRSGPEAPSALLSEGQRPPSSAARRFARSGVYALAASFLFRLPTVRLRQEGKREMGMRWEEPPKPLSLSTPGYQALGRASGTDWPTAASQQPCEEGNGLQRGHQLGSDGASLHT